MDSTFTGLKMESSRKHQRNEVIEKSHQRSRPRQKQVENIAPTSDSKPQQQIGVPESNNNGEDFYEHKRHCRFDNRMD